MNITGYHIDVSARERMTALALLAEASGRLDPGIIGVINQTDLRYDRTS